MFFSYEYNLKWHLQVSWRWCQKDGCQLDLHLRQCWWVLSFQIVDSSCKFVSVVEMVISCCCLKDRFQSCLQLCQSVMLLKDIRHLHLKVCHISFCFKSSFPLASMTMLFQISKRYYLVFLNECCSWKDNVLLYLLLCLFYVEKSNLL